MTSGLESMKKKVYHAAKEGLSISLYAHLSVTPREECQELLGQVWPLDFGFFAEIFLV